VDRHEHIGQGAIGLAGFAALLNDPRFAGHPMVIETEKGDDLQEDRENLRVLRGLIKNPGIEDV
jgi:deoxyribonuclease-4